MTYTRLHTTSETLRQFILDDFLSDVGATGLATFFSGANRSVSLQTPEEMEGNQQGLSLWLYRVVRDEHRLNDPPVVRPLPSGRVELVPPPLPLRLHYLATPLATGSPDPEQRILGRVLQLFHTYPVVSGAALGGALTGTEVQIHVRLESLSLDEITRVWEALEGSYQLSVSYEVTLANIESAAQPVRGSVVESVRNDAALIVAREG